MGNINIGLRYATALFEVAREQQELTNVVRDLLALQEALEHEPAILEIWNDKHLARAKIKQMFRDALEKFVHPLTMNFIELLIDKRRTSILNDTIRSFLFMADKERGLLYVDMTVAERPSQKAINYFARDLSLVMKKQVHLDITIEPAILGGFILMINDYRIDKSYRNSLEQLEKSIIGVK
ncbi:MAG: ATP synthase F1 subunit delta [Clostridia bacterium]